MEQSTHLCDWETEFHESETRGRSKFSRVSQSEGRGFWPQFDDHPLDDLETLLGIGETGKSNA